MAAAPIEVGPPLRDDLFRRLALRRGDEVAEQADADIAPVAGGVAGVSSLPLQRATTPDPSGGVDQSWVEEVNRWLELMGNKRAAKAKLIEATEIAMQELGIIPLHYQVNIWAMRKGLTYKARTDAYTLAYDISGSK